MIITKELEDESMLPLEAALERAKEVCGFTYKDLAEVMPVSSAAISQWKDKRPKDKTIYIMLSKGLKTLGYDIEPEYFFEYRELLAFDKRWTDNLGPIRGR